MNRYRCKQGNHFTDAEHNGQTCPYDNVSASELAEELKVDLSNKIDFVELNNHYNWAVENGIVSPLIDFAYYKQIALKLTDIAMGKIVADGTRIKVIKNHCIDRVCGTTEKQDGVKHEGILIEDFEETLFNGKVIRKPSQNQNKVYIVGKCIITIDYKQGALIQCNKLK